MPKRKMHGLVYGPPQWGNRMSLPTESLPENGGRKGDIPAWVTPRFNNPAASNAQEGQHANRFAPAGEIARCSAILGVGDSVAFQVIDGILNGADIPGFIVGDFHLSVIGGELLFKGHD